ncbi:unnamed protein product [Rotaria sp. Silwood1]|nr:unnamed protein product [Rotaria sp. Silwood1]CAF1681782.1 unnamed protein product [Rotaria sp. Silwood1]
MKKTIRQVLTNNHSRSIGVQSDCSSLHEFNIILHKLGPAVARTPDAGSTNYFVNPFIIDQSSITNHDHTGDLVECLLVDLLDFLLINNDNKPKQQHKIPRLIINNTIKIICKHHLINDLTKIIHNIQLSNPKLIDTINVILKPIETLSYVICYVASSNKSGRSQLNTNQIKISNQQ